MNKAAQINTLRRIRRQCPYLATEGGLGYMCDRGNTTAKAKVGSWITLAEWVYDEDKGRTIPKCVKTEYVDGTRIKADTWYKLIDGKFIKS